MRMLGPMVVSVLLLGLTAESTAQEFELDVVSVREGGGEFPQITFLPGRMVVDLPLRGLVWFALALPAQQVEGWPDPRLRERRFTLAATYSGARAPALAVQRRLVREILEDRFGMRARVEQREQAVYALRLIKPGVLGPGVVQVEYNCLDPEIRARRPPEDCPRSTDRFEARGVFWRGSGPMDVLVSRLQVALGDRVVVDQTGLDGFYRFELLLFEGGPARLPLPTVRELLPEQLRMTIEETRALVDVAILDAIFLPTPN